jgi:hypothetical protein
VLALAQLDRDTSSNYFSPRPLAFRERATFIRPSRTLARISATA